MRSALGLDQREEIKQKQNDLRRYTLVPQQLQLLYGGAC
jgi:hypothetical protein